MSNTFSRCIFSLEHNKPLANEEPTPDADPGEVLTPTHITIIDTFPWG